MVENILCNFILSMSFTLIYIKIPAFIPYIQDASIFKVRL